MSPSTTCTDEPAKMGPETGQPAHSSVGRQWGGTEKILLYILLRKDLYF